MDELHSSRDIKINMPFFLYFTAMFCFYKYGYFQLAIQLILVAYLFLVFLKRGLKLTKKTVKNLVFFVSWFGAFTILQFLSKTWAYGTIDGPSTVLITLRIFAIGFIMFFIADNKEKTISIFKSYAYAFLIVSIVVLVITPVSEWGNEYIFGRIIAQHRNSLGAVSSILVVLCFYLYKHINERNYLILSMYFIFFTIVTGSRSAMLSIVICVVIALFVNEKSLSKKIRNFLAFCLVFLAAIMIILSVPFLYNLVWVRMENAIFTVLGIESADSSTMGRENLKEVATIMFFRKPWLGYGVDGVASFLKDASYIIGEKVSSVYSHCNYTEIAACFGVVGLVIWYIPMIKVLLGSFKVRKNSKWAGCLFAAFITVLMQDYSQIPWSTHLNMYLIIILILFIRNEDTVKVENKYNHMKK